MECRFCEEKAEEETGMCPTCTEFIGRMQVMLKVNPIRFCHYLWYIFGAAAELDKK
jgi:hypothetical protein